MAVFDQRNSKIGGSVENIVSGVRVSRFDWVKVIDNWILSLRPFKAVVLFDGSFDLKKGDTIGLSGKCTNVNTAKAIVDTFLFLMLETS
mgnify:FL=1